MRKVHLLIASVILLIVSAHLWAETTDIIKNNSYIVSFTLNANEGQRVTNQDFATISFEDSAFDIYFSTSIKKMALSGKRISVPLKIGESVYVYRRGNEVKIELGDAKGVLFTIPRVNDGSVEYISSANIVIDDFYASESDSVYFTDDFMRDVQESNGEWEIISGDWGIHLSFENGSFMKMAKQSNQRATTRAQNPFNWTGTSTKKDEVALSLVGDDDWEDYTFETSMKAQKGSEVGAMVHYQSENGNGILFLWSCDSTQKNPMKLYKREKGKLSLLDSKNTYLLPNEWYRLKIATTFSGVTVYIDDSEVLRADYVGAGRGGAALAVRNGSAIFDDVAIYGKDIDTDLLYEIQAEQNAQGFASDAMMSFWNSPEKYWSKHMPTSYYKHNVYGDYVWVSGTVNVYSRTTGVLTLGLNATMNDPTSGYRAELTQANGGNIKKVKLYENETVLAEQDVDVSQQQGGIPVRFLRNGETLTVFINDVEALTAEITTEVEGFYPTITTTGAFRNFKKFSVYSYNMLEYTFATSPVDWYTEGNWMSTLRWACAPEWSFLSGWSRGPAVLWHKKVFTGDHSISAYMGFKVEYPRETDIYFYRQRDLKLTICGDGIDPNSGYVGWYRKGSGNTFASETREVYYMQILKNGEVVAEKPIPQWITNGWHHRSWYNLSLTKEGNKITLMCKSNPSIGYMGVVEQEVDLSYEDPEPLLGGSSAIWVDNTGFSIAKAEVSFRETPTTRTAPRVTIDADPYYPDYALVGRPLTVTYDELASSNGIPLQLAVSTMQTPNETVNDIIIKGNAVTFTPSEIGRYWYKVNAVETKAPFVVSPTSHIDLPVFDPEKHKATSEDALVVYKFNEGDGDIIVDHSVVEPKLDLEIKRTDDLNTATLWRVDRGLYLGADSKLTSVADADKLSRIAETKQFTLEVWHSPDSMQPDSVSPAYQLTTGIMSWDQAENQNPNNGNMTISGFTDMVYLVPKGTYWRPNYEAMKTPGMHTSLHHFVITWDGKATSFYEDGELKWSVQNLNWVPANGFNKGYKLHVANLANGFAPLYGSLYFFAFYDKAMASEDILNNYYAGPER